MDTKGLRIAFMPKDRRREHCHFGVTHYLTETVGIGVSIHIERHEGGWYKALIGTPINRCTRIDPQYGRRWHSLRDALAACRDYVGRVYADRLFAKDGAA